MKRFVIVFLLGASLVVGCAEVPVKEDTTQTEQAEEKAAEETIGDFMYKRQREMQQKMIQHNQPLMIGPGGLRR